MSTQILGPDLHFDFAKAALGSANATLTITPLAREGIAIQIVRNPPVPALQDPDRQDHWAVGVSIDGAGRIYGDGYWCVSGKKVRGRNGKWRLKEPGESRQLKFMFGACSDEEDKPTTAACIIETNGNKQWGYLQLNHEEENTWGVHADGSMHSYAKGVQITFGAAAPEPPPNILAQPKWVDVRIEGDDRPYRMKLYPASPGPVLPALPGAGQGINS